MKIIAFYSLFGKNIIHMGNESGDSRSIMEPPTGVGK